LIKVTIITGFLGAGKTTLLNRLIAQHQDRQLAIIENEFGAVGIDSDLLVALDKDVFELSNGCICCTLNGELIDTLAKLLTQERPIEHLIIETTGIAEPDSIASAFLSDPAIQSAFQLDGVICLVDAVNLANALDDSPSAQRQITFADVLVLNKAAEVHPNHLLELKAKLAEMNPLAELLEANHGEFTDQNPDLLQLNAYQNQNLEAKIEALVLDTVTVKHQGLKAHTFQFERPFDFLKFMHWSRVLLMIQGQNIYRIKGILDLGPDEVQKMTFQSVRGQAAFSRGSEWTTIEPRKSKLVVIGKDLKREMLEKALGSCLKNV
jgi:G3E family GTPase